MKKILITGASTYGVKNHGDDAMFSVFCQGIKKNIPDSEIIFLTRHPNKDFDKLYGVKSIKNFEHDSKKQSLGRWFNGFNPNDSTKHLEVIKNAFLDADLVVIGGNSFMEVSSSDFLRGVTSYSALIATLAKFFGKQYVLYGVAVYPMKFDYTKQMARFLCNNSSLVTLRETPSKEELLKAGVINNKNLKVLSDPVFAINPILDQKKALKLLDKDGIKLTVGKKIVGIAFRSMYWQWGKKELDKHAAKVAKLADLVIDKFDNDVIFIPNCTYNIDTPYEDDRYVAKIVRRKMKNKLRAHLIQKEYNLFETLTIYSLFNLLISNRRHALIFATVSGVTPFAISTGHLWHFKPWMEELGATDQLVDITTDNYKTIEKRLLETFENKKKINDNISHKIIRLRQKALYHTKLIAQLLKNNI